MQHIIVNGVKTEYIHCMDRGLHYGDGVFETIKYFEGRLLFWDEHIKRMCSGARRLNMSSSEVQLFYKDIKSILAELSNRNCIIKLIQTRGLGKRGYKYTNKQMPTRIVIIDEDIEADKPHAVELRYCKHSISINPSLAGIKHLNRLDNVLARNEWRDEEQEGLMLDMDENIVEGTMSNVFGIKNGTLYTPDLSRCGVEGIIRDQVLQIAAFKNIKIQINNIKKSDMVTMDEVFITNSIIGIRPVGKIEHTVYKTQNLTRMFIEELTKRMQTYAKDLA